MTDVDGELLAYALGALDAAQAEALEVRLDGDARLRAELVRAVALMTRIDETDAPLTPPSRLRDALLRAVDPDTRFETFAPRVAELFDLPQDRVTALLHTARSPGHAPWEDSGIPGTRLLHFDGGPRMAAHDCGLVHLAPGAIVPPHRHLGDEWALLLAGRLLENDTKEYLPGDLALKRAGSVHRLRVLGDAPALLALATQTGIDFRLD